MQVRTITMKHPTKPACTGCSKPCHKGQSEAFPPETLSEHRRLRKSISKHIRSTRWLVILSSPVIYACVFPVLLLDAAVALYQFVCFPICGIPKVSRGNYLVF
jgi:hypothetical protein